MGFGPVTFWLVTTYSFTIAHKRPLFIPNDIHHWDSILSNHLRLKGLAQWPNSDNLAVNPVQGHNRQAPTTRIKRETHDHIRSTWTKSETALDDYLWYWACRNWNSSLILSHDSATVNLKPGWPGWWGAWKTTITSIKLNYLPREPNLFSSKHWERL